jgi:3-mercaptopyruvate sulfurtransferase SseA
MNFRKCALLLMAIMLALAGAAQAQRTKSKSKAKKSAKVTNTTPAKPVEQAAPAEHQAEGEVPRITVEELKEKLAKNAPVFIIDSRSQGSYDGSEIKIKGAVRIPMDEVESRLSEIPHDRQIVVYCT